MNIVKWLSVVLLLWATAASAHDIRPVYVQLDETMPGNVDVLLKLPLFRDSGMAAAHPRFSKGCHESMHAPARSGEETVIEAWQMHCDKGLAGVVVTIDGFSALAPDALVLVHFSNGAENHYVLSAAHPSVTLQAAAKGDAKGTSLAAYLPIGVEHILLGFDHLMFVLGLILVVWRSGAGLRTLLATVTAFTLAHSITLAASAIGGWSLPSATVETLIALSILMLAVELAHSIRDPSLRPVALTFRKPWVLAFVFGLLHGFGFAGALQETGLPPDARGLALLLFNFGVEVGQLLFIAAVLGIWRIAGPALRLPLPRAAGVATWLIGVISAAWVLDRAGAIFTA